MGVGMNINFGGFVPVSTVDWYGVSAAVVFFRGCPLKCKDCQNTQLMSGNNIVPEDSIIEKIKQSEPLVSGVVFTGGEPLGQIYSLDFLLDWCKKRGLKTYLHTSGIFPTNLNSVIKKIDGVRIDYKPREQIDHHKLYNNDFYRSLEIIKNSNVEYWVSMVSTERNKSVINGYKLFGVDPKHIIVVQGNENGYKTVEEMKSDFPGVWICTREEGLKWNGK